MAEEWHLLPMNKNKAKRYETEILKYAAFDCGLYRTIKSCHCKRCQLNLTTIFKDDFVSQTI